MWCVGRIKASWLIWRSQPSLDAQVQAAAQHFLKVSQSYGAGLFYCYDQADLPRTNNDLEHYFGAYRYHQRRASGRKTGGLGWYCAVRCVWWLPR